ncbi:hypothetical protein BKA70DRAFT_1104335, partial [Coprinopsis sp. MPI-PUGE-AT-0042]
MLVSPVHALVQVWQIRGGQHKYTGHICNFPRDNRVFFDKLPLLPAEIDIIIMRRKGTNPETHLQTHEDFRVRRQAVRAWLQYLQEHHPTFRSRRVQVSEQRLSQLPQNGSIYSQIQSIETEEHEDTFIQEGGPPEEPSGQNNPVQESIYSGAYAPNIHDGVPEIERLRQALPPELRNTIVPDGPLILSVPHIHGTPIAEHTGISIDIDAFPTLFPHGEGSFQAVRPTAVTLEEWGSHLIRLKGGKFAQHPQFRYWVLNTIMRQK